MPACDASSASSSSAGMSPCARSDRPAELPLVGHVGKRVHHGKRSSLGEDRPAVLAEHGLDCVEAVRLSTSVQSMGFSFLERRSTATGCVGAGCPGRRLGLGGAAREVERRGRDLLSFGIGDRNVQAVSPPRVEPVDVRGNHDGRIVFAKMRLKVAVEREQRQLAHPQIVEPGSTANVGTVPGDQVEPTAQKWTSSCGTIGPNRHQAPIFVGARHGFREEPPARAAACDSTAKSRPAPRRCRASACGHSREKRTSDRDRRRSASSTS